MNFDNCHNLTDAAAALLAVLPNLHSVNFDNCDNLDASAASLARSLSLQWANFCGCTGQHHRRGVGFAGGLPHPRQGALLWMHKRHRGGADSLEAASVNLLLADFLRLFEIIYDGGKFTLGDQCGGQ